MVYLYTVTLRIGIIRLPYKHNYNFYEIILHTVTFILLVIGGLNWLLVGVFGWDVGQIFGGQGAIISRIVYILVGLSAIYEILGHKSNCKECSTTPMQGSAM